MARLNTASKIPALKTHEGAPAKRISAEAQLRRSVLSCLLWENEFYEDGRLIADRIVETAAQCDEATVADLAIEARAKYGLRHVPLLLLCDLIWRGGENVKHVICDFIQRPDEICELVAVYWRNGRRPLTRQMKIGLARAFNKFDEYRLAKYDRDGPIKLRDVMRLVHPVPGNDAQAALFKRVLDRTLKTPDTWEIALSGGADKKETFERLLSEGKLGYLALLRNLRNMGDAGVDPDLVKTAILARKGADLVFPFRFVVAARAAPRFEPVLDAALCANIGAMPELKGETIVLVDVSGSMNDRLSAKSDMMRMDAAAALASVINAESLRVFSFSNRTVEVPARRGMSGVDAIRRRISTACARFSKTRRPAWRWSLR